VRHHQGNRSRWEKTHHVTVTFDRDIASDLDHLHAKVSIPLAWTEHPIAEELRELMVVNRTAAGRSLNFFSFAGGLLRYLSRRMLVYAVTIFLSAFLLFQVQPLIVNSFCVFAARLHCGVRRCCSFS